MTLTKAASALATALLVLGCGKSNAPTSDAGAEQCVPLAERFDANTALPKGCYLAQTTPVIGSKVTLTLQPGVTIIFSQGVGLAFSGDQVLIASGTQAEPILFTGASAERGYWKGITFDGTSNVSRLDYATVEYAGSTISDADAAAVKLTADSRGVRLAVTHTTLRQSQGWGLWLAASAGVSEFSSNVLTENALGPASVDSEVVGVLDPASIYTGNDVDQLRVRAYRVSTAATWSALGVPYYLDSSLMVDGVDWTLAPGTTLIMAQGAELRISGDGASLIAEGTAASPILFTGAAQARGAWAGIVFDGSNNTRNSLAHATVEWAGDTTSDPEAAAVKLTSDSHGVQAKLSQVTLTQSQGYGLHLSADALVPLFSDNALKENALGPAWVASEVAHQLLTSSTYTGNDVDRVAVHTNRISQTVTWLDLGVPYELDGGVTVDEVWTLAPGVTLIMDSEAGVFIPEGTGFHAVGTAEKPITVTGAQKVQGAWDSIVFDDTRSAANVLDYCIVEYGGGGAAAGEYGMIIAQSDSRGVALAVNHSTLQHSAVYGIWLGSYASATLTSDTYSDNASGDVYQQ